MSKWVYRLLLAAFFTIVFPSNIYAYYTNMPASIVVGQNDFASGTSNQGGTANAATLSNPYDALIVNEKLIVTDFSNHRVLIYNKVPTTNGVAADVVIGQSSFSGTTANSGGRGANTLSGPQAIDSDGTRLFVVDGSNHRVLIYNNIPTTNNTSADVVIGQTDFSGGSANQGGSPGANTLNTPTGVKYYNGKLIIVDNTNNRVLIFNNIPTTNNASADVVVGQVDFSGVSANQGGSAAANTLWFPAGAEVDNGKLIISEVNSGGNGNKRLLVFNSIPTTNNAVADVVIFQPNFSSNTANQGGSTSANSIISTRFIWSYEGKLFVPEDNSSGNNRVLVFNSIPTINNASADMVIGQSNFTASTANQGGTRAANTLNRPTGGFSDKGRLVIVDRINSRVLIYYDVYSSPQVSISPVNITDKDVKYVGNVKLGERGKYFLQKILVSINGDGFAPVSYLDGGRDDGSDSTTYDFYHSFTNNQISHTAKFMAYGSSGEIDTVFKFSPFNLQSLDKKTIKIYLGEKNWNIIKDNLSSIDILIKISKGSWQKIADTIYLKDEYYNISNGLFTYEIKDSLPSSSFEIKVVAVDKWQNSQESNILSYTQKSDSNLIKNQNTNLKINDEILETRDKKVQETPSPAPDVKLEAKDISWFQKIINFFLNIFK